MSFSDRLRLAEKRGRLLAQSAAQRQMLSQQAQPLAAALAVADHGVEVLTRIKRGMQRQPAMVGAAVALLFILRPRRLFRWSRRAWLVWKAVGGLRQRFRF